MSHDRQTKMKKIFDRWSVLCSCGLALLAAMVLTACGGGGTVPSPGVNIRALDSDFTSRMAVAYSPYRTSTSEAGLGSETIPLANIKQDLQLLRQAGFGAVRLFDSSDKVAAQTVQAIRELNLDMKVMLGLWITANNSAANEAEINRAVALAIAYPDIIKAISVGNETLVSWNTWNPQTTQNMASYLKTVRSRVSQPVTTDDNWAFFAAQNGEKNPDAVLKEIDFVSMHTYPLLDTVHNPNLWDWRQTSVSTSQRAQAMMDAAIERAKYEYRAVRAHLDQYGYAAMPVIVGETGWKAVASGGETMRAHPVNQAMYFDRLRAWKQQADGPKTVVYFSAFDEAWKQGDDKWGVFNAQRQARCVAQSLNSNLLAESGSCAAADAVYYQAADNQGTITANRYTVYAEQVTSGEARAGSGVVLNAWQNGTTATAVEIDQSSADGSKVIQINPTPLSWGWGMTWGLSAGAEVDLSNFQGGTLNFSIKTTYPAKIEIGFLTGNATDGSAWDVYLPISPGEYGYQNDGQWHTVSIPIANIAARGAMAYGMTNPVLSKLQLNRVSNMFVLADRYSFTGKQDNANVRDPILIDAIHWSR